MESQDHGNGFGFVEGLNLSWPRWWWRVRSMLPLSIITAAAPMCLFNPEPSVNMVMPLMSLALVIAENLSSSTWVLAGKWKFLRLRQGRIVSYSAGETLVVRKRTCRGLRCLLTVRFAARLEGLWSGWDGGRVRRRVAERVRIFSSKRCGEGRRGRSGCRPQWCAWHLGC